MDSHAGTDLYHRAISHDWDAAAEYLTTEDNSRLMDTVAHYIWDQPTHDTAGAWLAEGCPEPEESLSSVGLAAGIAETMVDAVRDSLVPRDVADALGLDYTTSWPVRVGARYMHADLGWVHGTVAMHLPRSPEEIRPTSDTHDSSVVDADIWDSIGAGCWEITDIVTDDDGEVTEIAAREITAQDSKPFWCE